MIEVPFSCSIEGKAHPDFRVARLFQFGPESQTRRGVRTYTEIRFETTQPDLIKFLDEHRKIIVTLTPAPE